MTAGLSVCLMLAVLCTSCLGLPFSSQRRDQSQLSGPSEALLVDAQDLGELHLRHRRSAAQMKAPLEEDAESRANLSELLARLIANRKGSLRRNSTANNKISGLAANHRIADRDYTGWMDFGRRSAEEYEYSL